MAKVKVWQRADGGISVTHFDFRLKNPGETDEEFIERCSVRLRLDMPSLASALDEIIMDDSELPARDGNRDKWRLDGQKKVKVDNTVELPRERKEKKAKEARDKFKSLGLTDEELEAFKGN